MRGLNERTRLAASTPTARSMSRLDLVGARRADSSSFVERACETSPSEAISRASSGECPCGAPYATTGHPRARASSEVTPPVEWTRTSAAASRSFIRSVNPSTLTRGSPAKARKSRARVSSSRPARQSTVLSARRSPVATAPDRSPTAQPPPDTTTTTPVSGKSSARRASALDRGARNSPATSRARGERCRVPRGARPWARDSRASRDGGRLPCPPTARGLRSR